MKCDVLMNDSRTIVMVDCELVREYRRLHAGWVAMAPGNYFPVEWFNSPNGLKIGVQIPVNVRSRITSSTICHPTEPIFFDLDSEFAKDFFK